MTVLGLHHVQIACPPGSEDDLRDFYGGLLGLIEVPKPPALAARTLAAAGCGTQWDTAIPAVRRFHTDDAVGNRLEIQQA